MVVGFNHNIRYKGELFHVQTEDSGRSNPHVITLLYRGGTILGSAKTSYADIVTTEQLEAVVESIMKEQHKDMMRRLKAGEFDAKIFPNGAPAEATPRAAQPDPPANAAPQPAPAAPVQAPQAAVAEQTVAPPSQTVPLSQAVPVTEAPAKAAPTQPVTNGAAADRPLAAPSAPKETPAPPPAAEPAPAVRRSLDEVILDYLITGEE